MKNFNYTHSAAPLVLTKNIIASATLMLLTSLSVASASPQGVETIKVKGQINSLLFESELDLTASSSPDLRQQLSQLPSVNINGNGRISGIVQYRGLYSDRVRVSIDDVLITGAGPNAMDSPLSHVIGNLLQQVTLYHAIAPVSAGAETLGGAIDISDLAPMLSNAQKVEYSGAITLSRFLNEGQSATAMFNAVNQHAYVAIIADKQEGNSFESGRTLIVPNTYFDRSGVKFSSGYQANDHKVSLFVSQRVTDDSGTPALAMDIQFIDALILGINYQYEMNDRWLLEAKLAGNNNEHDMNNFSQRSNSTPAMHRLNSVNSEGRSASLGFRQTNATWQNEFGIDMNMSEHNSNISNPNAAAFFLQNFNDVNRNLYSLFAQFQHNYTKQTGFLNWQAGIRASNVRANAQTVNTNMAMMNPNVRTLRDSFNQSDRKRDFSLFDLVLKTSYGFTENIKLQASAAIKQKAPSYSQLYSWFPLGVSAGLADGRNYLGNMNLKKESAAKVDLGLLIKGDDWVFMPNIFYTRVNDYIMGVTSSNVPANMIADMNNIQVPLVWQNQAATLSGFDFTYTYTLNRQLELTASGQYVRAKQTRDLKQDLYRIAPLSMDIGLKWRQKDYDISLLSRWVAAQNKVALLQNETPTSGYAVFDLQTNYEFNAGIEFSLLIENLLNKDYVNHLSGVNRVANSDIAKGMKLPSAGRNIGAFISYQF
jgi:iron complex outermembrane receptor protein